MIIFISIVEKDKELYYQIKRSMYAIVDMPIFNYFSSEQTLSMHTKDKVVL